MRASLAWTLDQKKMRHHLLFGWKALFAELEAQLTPTTPPPAEPSRWDEKGTQDNWKVSMPQVRRNGESAKRAQSSALDSAPRMPNQVSTGRTSRSSGARRWR